MVALQKNDANFYYLMIEVGCSDNPNVRLKGVRISEGPIIILLSLSISFFIYKRRPPLLSGT